MIIRGVPLRLLQALRLLVEGQAAPGALACPGAGYSSSHRRRSPQPRRLRRPPYSRPHASISREG